MDTSTRIRITAPTLEERMAALEARMAALEAGQMAPLPEECRQRECSYYSYYLAYGGPDLTHEGFHSAEKIGSVHLKSCRWNWEKGPCRLCQEWEARLRA